MAKGKKTGHVLTREDRIKGGKTGKRGMGFKSQLEKILAEKLPESIFEQIKETYGLDENIEQGEALFRAVIIRTLEIGSTKQLIDILKIMGEYEELEHNVKVELDHNIKLNDDTIKSIENAIITEADTRDSGEK